MPLGRIPTGANSSSRKLAEQQKNQDDQKYHTHGDTLRVSALKTSNLPKTRIGRHEMRIGAGRTSLSKRKAPLRFSNLSVLSR